MMSSVKMEEEDCESVTEAKTMSMKKKINVLEAMAKYNIKKQQEQEEKMKSTVKHEEKKVCTVKQEDKKMSTVKHEDKKKSTVKHEERKRNLPFVTTTCVKDIKQEKKEPQTELDIGITEYVFQGDGFSAILKQRYSDFHVYEISMDGTVVHLTDQSVPAYEEPKVLLTEEQKLAVLTAEQWSSLEEMIKSEEPKTVEIDVTEKSKADRQSIHKAVRSQFDNITSNSEQVDNRTVMKIFKLDKTKKQNGRNGRCVRITNPYTQFVLYKENLSTMEAISAVARRCRINASNFMTAGTKDKRGITSQLVTVKNLDPQKLYNSLKSDSKMAVGNFTFIDKPLELGHLKGNRFVIALRNVVGDESQITANLESLKGNGFINYYGAQRFGTRHVPTHYIGRQLLLGRWQEAIDLILEPPELTGKYQHDFDLIQARIEYRSSKDAFKAFNHIKRSLNTIEGQLLLNLKKFGKDLVGALNSIPRNLRLTYIHAYQSFLWNTVVSKRLAKFGFKPIVGDLVYAPGDEGDDSELQTEIDKDESQQEEAESEKAIEMEGDGAKKNKRKVQRNQRKVIFVDESNIDKYTINDVLLPLPGYDISYPSNEVAGWYTELLAVDGLSEMDFKRSVKTYNLGGAYRLVMSKPSDVKWKFVRYDNPTLNLIPSDWDRLENTQLPPAVVEGGAYLGIILEFNLPSAAYATMALREITKMDMSASFQSSLNEAGTNKQPATVEAASAAAADQEEPESKRIKQEPVTSDL